MGRNRANGDYSSADITAYKDKMPPRIAIQVKKARRRHQRIYNPIIEGRNENTLAAVICPTKLLSDE